MNERLEKFARDTLKEDLAFLGLHDMWYLRKFRLMYSGNNLGLSIDEVVDRMPAEKLDWALTQTANTLANHVKV